MNNIISGTQNAQSQRDMTNINIPDNSLFFMHMFDTMSLTIRQCFEHEIELQLENAILKERIKNLNKQIKELKAGGLNTKGTY